MLKTVRNLEQDVTLRESPSGENAQHQNSKPPIAPKEPFPGAQLQKFISSRQIVSQQVFSSNTSEFLGDRFTISLETEMAKVGSQVEEYFRISQDFLLCLARSRK